jgi:hypothetical protein
MGKETIMRKVERGAVLQLACVILATLMLAGCATMIKLEVQRTPTLDTKGIERIAIMPFEGNSSAAQYATTVATSNIQATNQFTLVSPSRINDVKRSGESLENYVDALFVGQITNAGSNTTSQQGSYRNRDGTVTTYTDYTIVATVSFTYHLERARDGSMIGPITKSGRISRTARNDPSALPSATALINNIIDNQLRYLNRDLVTHTITVQRKMEKDPDKNLKQPMEAALAQVKSGSYISANQAYLAIWESKKSVAAAVNASILYEALGETQTAAIFMRQVLDTTGSPMARDALARLNNELAQQAGVEQFDEAQTPVEKATSYAISEVQKVLPSGAKLWIHNNASSNQDLTNAVIDNMMSLFIASGVPVIERQMIDLVLKEQNFQLSGNVSDADFVSIGNLAGANTIVIVAVTGTGAGRRLQVRVLDIQAGTVVMQSGTGSEWNL